MTQRTETANRTTNPATATDRKPYVWDSMYARLDAELTRARENHNRMPFNPTAWHEAESALIAFRAYESRCRA